MRVILIWVLFSGLLSAQPIPSQLTIPPRTWDTRALEDWATPLATVPSLKGVWYRGLYGHDGAVARLEDWFDSARLRPDYVPAGFKGVGVAARSVPGHEFGLSLKAEDKKALIAFLKSL